MHFASDCWTNKICKIYRLVFRTICLYNPSSIDMNYYKKIYTYSILSEKKKLPPNKSKKNYGKKNFTNFKLSSFSAFKFFFFFPDRKLFNVEMGSLIPHSFFTSLGCFHKETPQFSHCKFIQLLFRMHIYENHFHPLYHPSLSNSSQEFNP